MHFLKLIFCLFTISFLYASNIWCLAPLNQDRNDLAESLNWIKRIDFLLQQNQIKFLPFSMEIIEKTAADIIPFMLDDFYWNRVLSMSQMIDLIRQGLDFQKIIDKSSLNQIEKDEITLWCELINSKLLHQDILNVSHEINKFEINQIINELNAFDIKTISAIELTAIIEKAVNNGVKLREQFIKQKDSDKPLCLAAWNDISINQKFHTLKPQRNELKDQRALIFWQTLLDTMKINQWFTQQEGEPHTNIRRQFYKILSDFDYTQEMFKNIKDQLHTEMQKNNYQSVPELDENDNTRIIHQILINAAVKIASNPLNQVEKGRVGALIMHPNGTLLSTAFDGAPLALGRDDQHMGRCWAFDDLVSKIKNEIDMRWRFDLRRSPCAEKKAVFQAIARGFDIKDLKGASLISSRSPCYQCSIFLKQIDIGNVLSPNEERDYYSSIVDRNLNLSRFIVDINPENIKNQIEDNNRFNIFRIFGDQKGNELSIKAIIQELQKDQKNHSPHNLISYLKNALHPERKLLRNKAQQGYVISYQNREIFNEAA